ncbi:phospholipase D-like domain-containing protein [Enhygromyxa salina]|uniref:Major cardiolipin synthase ClsA n=1 Tax=Enhygromyxa salina TaxID=215803 RepID=A0A2S9XTC1_9BACT|nr:phospholipase D-like domain-containing protein [Enhygromyxa salina]PRP96118.1 Major cardiolipin synthase ClsA [Enhygromyxa salina]
MSAIATQSSRAAALGHVLTASTGLFPAPLGSIRRLRNGDQIFPAMLAAIEGAQRQIGFVTFVYWTGTIADRFADALADAARRGVEVRVVLDAVGARAMKERLIDSMREAGVIVRWYRPLSPWRIWESTHRTHRKLLVVDGQLGFTGGVGIAKEWEGDARDSSQWRDSHFELDGTAVLGLWGAFLATWLEAGGDPIAPPTPAPTPASEQPLRAHVVPATAAIGWTAIATALWGLIDAAERSIKIATAYFTPDDETVERLGAKARSGVDVDLLLPGDHADQRVVKMLAEPKLRPLIEAGVHVYYFRPTMMHTKVLIIDDVFTCFGSANINSRSMRKDEEILVATGAAALVQDLLIDFAADLERSRLLTVDELRERPWWQRALTTLMAPLDSEI